MGKGCLFWFLPFNKTKKINNDKSTNQSANRGNNQITYSKVRCLITETEEKFYIAFRAVIQDKYIIQPQVNLATIIKKHSDEFVRQNELYRNIDFCIFSKNYEPLLLIEINDETHNEPKRRARDAKVKSICSQANIPLIFFWTSYGVNHSYINYALKQYLDI